MLPEELGIRFFRVFIPQVLEEIAYGSTPAPDLHMPLYRVLNANYASLPQQSLRGAQERHPGVPAPLGWAEIQHVRYGPQCAAAVPDVMVKIERVIAYEVTVAAGGNDLVETAPLRLHILAPIYIQRGRVRPILDFTKILDREIAQTVRQ